MIEDKKNEKEKSEFVNLRSVHGYDEAVMLIILNDNMGFQGEHSRMVKVGLMMNEFELLNFELRKQMSRIEFHNV